MVEIQVVRIEDKEIVQKISCPSMSVAERVERGILINLNFEEYFVQIKE